MPSAGFGAIKLVQKRTGAPRSVCKAALESQLNDDGDIDEECAIAHIVATTDHVDSAAAEKAEKAEHAHKGGFFADGTEPSGSSVSHLTIEVGDGETYPRYGDTLFVHYKGLLSEDGTEFDSSYKRNREFSFRIGMGKVIRGWDVGIMKMSLGEKALLLISADYAYGVAGSPPTIPPNADLKFEVHLTRIERQTSCLGPGQKDSKQTHEYAAVARQLLGQE